MKNIINNNCSNNTNNEINNNKNEVKTMRKSPTTRSTSTQTHSTLPSSLRQSVMQATAATASCSATTSTSNNSLPTASSAKQITSKLPTTESKASPASLRFTTTLLSIVTSPASARYNNSVSTTKSMKNLKFASTAGVL